MGVYISYVTNQKTGGHKRKRKDKLKNLLIRGPKTRGKKRRRGGGEKEEKKLQPAFTNTDSQAK
jgi:hypothetical protein